MKKILLIVSNHEDAKLLPNAAKVIGRIGCSQLWVWHSPILGIDPDTECRVIDDEIKALVAGEKDAAVRGDYKTAEERKAAREKLLLNRSVEIRNAWKRVSAEGRKEAIGRFMEPLLDVLNPKRVKSGIGVRISAFPEHQEADIWIAALNEVKMVLEKDGFKGGEFAMMWPKQLVALGDALANQIFPSRPVAPTITQEQKEEYERKAAQPKVPVPPMTFNAETRRAELLSFPLSKLIAMGRPKGIKTKGKEAAEIVNEIVAIEEVKAM